MTRDVTWQFDQPPNEAAFTLRGILERGEPILLVGRDSEDGTWLFLTGATYEYHNLRIVTLKSVVDTDSTLNDIRDLPVGWEAARTKIGAEWNRQKIEEL